jgi:hypothetical protein
MCTLVIHRRPANDWPVLIAANRDEMKARPWDAPARHWPDRPETVAGRDRLADGSWLGHNDHGVVAAVLNRHGTLGPAADKRSRGELVLEALEHADAEDAARALADLNPDAYRSFNLVIADNRSAWWLANSENAAHIAVEDIPEGLSMLTSRDLNDVESERIEAYLPAFRAAAVPDPDSGDWSAWRDILTRGIPPGSDDPTAAMCIDKGSGYGTVSSSLIAIAAPERRTGKASPDIWLFAPGAPNECDFSPVAL